jgi:uncharacterized protein (DUF433 family)
MDLKKEVIVSAIAIQPDAPPLRQDSSGELRVGASRVLLEMVIHAFQQGETPEGIVQRFPSLGLSEVYGVIAYYLKHQPEVDAYLAERNHKGEEVRRQIEQSQGDMQDLRARLLARRGKIGA